MQICVLHVEVCTLSTKTCLDGVVADAEKKQVTRDVRERGRDIEGCIKQWVAYVKPNFGRYVQPQREIAGKAT